MSASPEERVSLHPAVFAALIRRLGGYVALTELEINECEVRGMRLTQTVDVANRAMVYTVEEPAPGPPPETIVLYTAKR
jgi:hypothetical protein